MKRLVVVRPNSARFFLKKAIHNESQKRHSSMLYVDFLHIIMNMTENPPNIILYTTKFGLVHQQV